MNAYFRLMRFDKPIGIFLLLWPTLWALWLAASGRPPLSLICIFLLGTVVMRSAGCVINDIADRKIDPHVLRTKMRPLATNEVSLKHAVLLFVSLLLFSCTLLLFLNPLCFYWAIPGVLITVLYPYCKRFFAMPQLVLGFAFSWGIPMAFIAVLNTVTPSCFFLMLMTYCWIVAYDTAYAMTDIDDDIKMGVNSTAIFFGHAERLIIACLQGTIALGWLVIAWYFKLNHFFYLFWCLAMLLFLYQQWLLKNREPEKCFKAFLNNHWYGLVMWLALLLS